MIAPAREDSGNPFAFSTRVRRSIRKVTCPPRPPIAEHPTPSPFPARGTIGFDPPESLRGFEADRQMCAPIVRPSAARLAWSYSFLPPSTTSPIIPQHALSLRHRQRHLLRLV